MKRDYPNISLNKMQKVPLQLLQVGVSYRVHHNSDKSTDLLGSLHRKITFIDGDVRYILYHLLVPAQSAYWREVPAKGSHVKETPG